MKALALVIHDAGAPTWDHCLQLRRAIAEIAPLPATWLVVPHFHDAPDDARFVAGLEAARREGDELALHGYTHLDPLPPRGFVDRALRRSYTAGEGEFSALSREQAEARLQAGRDWFQAQGWQPGGFVAPAWLMSEGTWQALGDARAEATFAYTCTLARITSLRSGRTLRSQSIVYSTRARWRRLLSNRWAAAVARWERENELLRFELHPHDVLHPSTRRSWSRLLREALEERTPLTLGDVARRLDADLSRPHGEHHRANGDQASAA